VLCSLVRADSDDVAERLESKNVADRLAAVAQIAEKGHPQAESLLQEAAEDRDWEVVQRAVDALVAHGSPASTDLLVDLAVKGPVRRIRLAAAAALAKHDPEEATKEIVRKLRGDTTEPAADALAVIAHPSGAETLEKLLRRRDAASRLAAVKALGALGDPERIELLKPLLTRSSDIRVRAAVVEALVRTGSPSAVGVMRERLKDAEMTAVMERRYIAGIRKLLLAIEDAEKRNFAALMCARTFGAAASPGADARFARLFGEFGRKDAPVGPVEEYVRTLLSVGLRHEGEQVRSATVAALAKIGASEAAYSKVADLAKADSSARVRFHALRAAVSLRGDATEDLLLDRLKDDEAPSVREEAAATLGKRRLKGAGPALAAALEDDSWEVCCAAAVSLGKLRDAAGVAPLKALLDERDWRRRASGVVGLGWIQQKDAIPLLITMLRDKEPAVAATALEFLRHISGKALSEHVKAWRAWWSEWEAKFEFRDADAEAKAAKKYGYAVTPRKVYDDLDIVVLQTRRGGDNIQNLLTDYGIEHRIIRAASVHQCGLHPYALFVANCPGEITKRDAERLKWYVRAGGYLFASCWALTHTVERCFPGVVEKLPTKAQVLDIVESTQCPSDSPLIEGVFDGVTRPYYMLEGSHLIHVLDPERFEVLIDSPQAATDWGGGNLAGWFTIGHGLVLDSANHFDLQGMVRFRLKTERERMAFAVDHLGYGYEELRKLQDEGVFAKQPSAVKRTRDLSIFRFITTFVRQKRLADEG